MATLTEAKQEVEFEENWGLKTAEIYKIALQFYKEKNGGKALTLSYNDRLMLLALTKQIAHGKYDSALVPDNGLFDVIGNNRRHVWQSLGDMSKSTAMIKFVQIINNVSPLFASVIEAHKIEKDEKEQQKKVELDEMEVIAKTKKEEELKKHQDLLHNQMAQELLIRNALHQQTYSQFLSYAQLQHPTDKSRQDVLISQLQEQHFLQYMQQVYNQQYQDITSQSHLPQKQSETCDSIKNCCTSGVPPSNQNVPSVEGSSQSLETEEEEKKQDIVIDDNSANISENHSENIEAASEWTRKDIKYFKESLKVENEAIIKVGSGELVTIRVPTHQDGTSLFWEFATDDLDIGFGLSFECDKEDVQKNGNCNSVEKKTDVIIPIARMQSHLEVQCGSHKYPGLGVYLLMFDNSYSLWRSKSIYYRVFYSN